MKKRLFIYSFTYLFISCQDKQNESLNSLTNIKDNLYQSYINRNPLSVYNKNINYLDSLTKVIPPNKYNIDIYYQIDFLLGFLDSRFHNESFESTYYDIETSPDAYKYQETPFNYVEHSIEDIIREVKSKKQDSLYIKYYLSEEAINEKILYEKPEEIYKYNNLLSILRDPPLNLHFSNTKSIIKKINKEELNLFNWQGEYSFGFGGTHMGEEYEGGMSIVISPDSTYLNYYSERIEIETGKIIDSVEKNNILAKIIKVKQDTLEIESIEDKGQYILYKTQFIMGGEKQDGFAIKGHAVYMLSPPNNDYPLTKKE